MAKSVIALGFSIVAFTFMVVSFASPYWVESFTKADSRFVKAGLWEFCFNDYTFWKDYNGKRYKGCWYIFSDQYRVIWEWLSPRKISNFPLSCPGVKSPRIHSKHILNRNLNLSSGISLEFPLIIYCDFYVEFNMIPQTQNVFTP